MAMIRLAEAADAIIEGDAFRVAGRFNDAETEAVQGKEYTIEISRKALERSLKDEV